MFDKILEFIEKAQNIAIISHCNPDGDTLGSNLALHMGLKKLFKKTTPICVDSLPAIFQYLPSSEEMLTDFNPVEFDLFIFIDCADVENLCGFYQRFKTFFFTTSSINIDHHSSNKNYATVNLVDSNKAATGLLIYQLLRQAKIRFDPEIATCLLTAIITDTGGFQHSNTSSECMAVAADLVDKGANLEKIMKSVFKSKSLSMLRLWGKVLSGIKFGKNKELVWALILRKEIAEIGATYEDLSGVISLIYGIPEAKVAVLLTEQENGKLKGSIRTKNGTDANKVASIFGGGGHKKAAGFVVPKLNQ